MHIHAYSSHTRAHTHLYCNHESGRKYRISNFPSFHENSHFIFNYVAISINSAQFNFPLKYRLAECISKKKVPRMKLLRYLIA